MEKEIQKNNFPILDTGEVPEAPAPREIIDLEGIFEKLENELRGVNASAEELNKAHIKLCEVKQILRKTQSFFEEVNSAYLFYSFPSMNFPLPLLCLTTPALLLSFYSCDASALHIWQLSQRR